MEAIEAEGLNLCAAGGSLELLARRALHPELQPFVPERYELNSHSALYGGGLSSATATIRVAEQLRSETEDGDGAVNALERALRQCLFSIYPEIATVRMTDYRVEPLDPAQGTMSRARVLLTWTNGAGEWITAGVARDIVEATWLALVDGFALPLMRLRERRQDVRKAGGSSWAG